MSDMGSLADLSRPETPGQWVARVLGLVSFFAVIGAVPVSHLTVGPARTAGAIPSPTGKLSFWNGDWSREMERHAQEISPVTFALRGHYTETLFELGLLEPSHVLLGSDGWMFMSSTLRVNQAALEAAAPKRRRTLESLRRRCDELGLKLLALPVPDKVRIYPEKAFPDGNLPPEKEDLYDRILFEFEAAGVEVLDVASVLQREKRAGANALYYERDTHWSAAASLAVAQAVQLRLRELGWEELGEPASLVPSAWRVEVVPDLVGILGFRAVPGPFEGSRGLVRIEGGDYQQISPLARSLTEEKDYFRLELAESGQRPNPSFFDNRHLGKVAIAGTSFSEDLFGWAVAHVLGRLVDTRGIVSAGGPFTGLEAQLGRIERGESRAAILLWEMVERSYLEPEWLEPPVF